MAYNFDPIERETATFHAESPIQPRLLIAIGAIIGGLGAYLLWGVGGVLLAGGGALALVGLGLLVVSRLTALLRARSVERPKRQH